MQSGLFFINYADMPNPHNRAPFHKSPRKLFHDIPAPGGSFRDKDTFKVGRKRTAKNKTPFEDLGQKWIMYRTPDDAGQYYLCDQYNFTIFPRSGERFELYHGDDFVLSLYTLEGAKAAALVLLNDKLTGNFVK